MVVAVTPKYRMTCGVSGQRRPKWFFVIEDLCHDYRLEASDFELGIELGRLELLALVRGLEALERPCFIQLETASRYVRRGLTYGLEEWRESGWRWESFGLMVPIKNVDLWLRVDRALSFHRLELCGSSVRIGRAWGVSRNPFTEPAWETFYGYQLISYVECLSISSLP